MATTITYAILVNIVKDYIKTHCMNIYNFAGLPACYRAGFGGFSWSGTNGHWGSMSGLTNPVVEVSAGTVDADMTTFLNAIGVTEDKLDYPIDDDNLEKFLTDLIAFTGSKVGYVVSQPTAAANNSKYTIYMNNNALDYTQTLTINPRPAEEGRVIVYSGTDMTNLINKFSGNIRKAARVYPIRFNFAVG